MNGGQFFLLICCMVLTCACGKGDASEEDGYTIMEGVILPILQAYPAAE